MASYPKCSNDDCQLVMFHGTGHMRVAVKDFTPLVKLVPRAALLPCNFSGALDDLALGIDLALDVLTSAIGIDLALDVLPSALALDVLDLRREACVMTDPRLAHSGGVLLEHAQ